MQRHCRFLQHNALIFDFGCQTLYFWEEYKTRPAGKDADTTRYLCTTLTRSSFTDRRPWTWLMEICLYCPILAVISVCAHACCCWTSTWGGLTPTPRIHGHNAAALISGRGASPEPVAKRAMLAGFAGADTMRCLSPDPGNRIAAS